MNNSLSDNSKMSLAQIQVFENAEGKQCVSARELHEKLETTERFSKWWDRFSSYGFEQNIDFMVCTKKYTANQFGGEKEFTDYEITIEMAKQICMLQRSEKGREYREYFLQLEKAWNSPEAIMSRALQIANKTLEDAKNQVVILQEKVEIVEAKNEALASDVLTWADRKVIQAIINKYGANILDGNFQLAWSEYKKELLYKYSINLNSRKTAYFNNGGKESNLKVLNLLNDSELPDAVRTAIAMAEKASLDISEIVQKSVKNQSVINEKYIELTLFVDKKGLDCTDIINFFRIRGYMRKASGNYEITALGLEKGLKKEGLSLFITNELAERLSNAFERERINKICKEAERRMKPSSIGKAE